MNHSCGHPSKFQSFEFYDGFICYDCTLKQYEDNKPINDIICLLFNLSSFPETITIPKTERRCIPITYAWTVKQRAYGHFIRSERLAGIDYTLNTNPNEQDMERLLYLRDKMMSCKDPMTLIKSFNVTSIDQGKTTSKYAKVINLNPKWFEQQEQNVNGK